MADLEPSGSSGLNVKPAPNPLSGERPLRRQVLAALGLWVGSAGLATPAWTADRPRARKLKATPVSAQAPASGTPYGRREDAMAFATEVAARRDLDPAWVRRAVAQALRLPVIQRLVLPPASPGAKNWQAYRARFVEPIRIRAGVSFWRAQAAALTRAEAEFGVPAEIIVGILGIETLYGRHMGDFRVMDALATLAFDFPTAHPRAAARQAFFREELEHYLSLTHRSGTDPLSLRGSYAGAMGMGQFMPSSWARHAIDFDGDGRIDLFASAADAIGSVASYFRAHD